jgi:Uma2 family endonuclease
MSGGSPNHSLLANRVGALLDRQCVARREQVPLACRVCNADLQIHIASSGTYTYADCSVVCEEPRFSGDQRDNILNPLLIVEVLSPCIEGCRRGRKFELYRTAGGKVARASANI